MKMPKSFSWSYSKLKNFETCPKRHNEVDLLKNFTDESDALTQGNQTHKILADACRTGELPPEYQDYQRWVDEMRNGPGELLIEQKWAIKEDFSPCEFFSPRAWYRGIGDVVRVDGPVALLRDWKTGKVLTDSVQLMLMSACVFAFHPKVRRVRAEFVWLKEDCCTGETFDRSTIQNEWIGVLQRVKALKYAYDKQDYQPTPNKLCAKWCPVKTCEYHGKRLG